MDAIFGTGKISKREFDIVVNRDVSISMSDGVDIDVNIFRPKSAEEFPVLLSIAAFNKDLQTEHIWPAPTRTRRIRGIADGCL